MTSQPEEVREIIPFIIAPRKIKYLGINLTMELKGIYHESFETTESVETLEYGKTSYDND